MITKAGWALIDDSNNENLAVWIEQFNSLHDNSELADAVDQLSQVLPNGFALVGSFEMNGY